MHSQHHWYSFTILCVKWSFDPISHIWEEKNKKRRKLIISGPECPLKTRLTLWQLVLPSISNCKVRIISFLLAMSSSSQRFLPVFDRHWDPGVPHCWVGQQNLHTFQSATRASPGTMHRHPTATGSPGSPSPRAALSFQGAGGCPWRGLQNELCP